jgi:hypothetical protein
MKFCVCKSYYPLLLFSLNILLELYYALKKYEHKRKKDEKPTKRAHKLKKRVTVMLIVIFFIISYFFFIESLRQLDAYLVIFYIFWSLL